jgi:hypothetical protein
MQFFRFYKNAPISEDVVIEMVQNVRNPVREVIIEMILEDIKTMYIPEPELVQFEYMAQIKYSLDNIMKSCDVSLSEDYDLQGSQNIKMQTQGKLPNYL